MKDKEKAEVLRKAADIMAVEWGEYTQEEAFIINLADELDPPRPDPGTVVWFRGTYFGASKDWQIGEASQNGVYPIGDSQPFFWKDVETKPGRILAPDEVAIRKGEPVRHEGKTYALVEIPDIVYWPTNAVSVNAAYICENNIFREYIKSSGLDFSIPRAKAALMEMEAERMEEDR